jgi:murein DD-endopeptidase MepM/ murein hydrolase activator NlpD
MNRIYSVVIVPDQGDVRQFSVRRSLLLALLSGVLLFVGCSAVFTVDFFAEEIDSYELASLRDENAFLSEMIEVINYSIDSLRYEIGEMTETELAIRTIFDLPQVDPQQRELGIGGPEMLPPDEHVTPSRLSAYQAEAEIDRLLVQSEIERQQLEDVYNSLVAKKDDLDCTPSIAPAPGWWTHGFGIRTDPFTGAQDFHGALDIANRVGTPILAPADGKVTFAGDKGRMGNTIVIEHGNGFCTKFGHLTKFEVKRGQKVKRGEVIALMGKSGRCTGPHLHYVVEKDGRPVNPAKYIYSSDYLAAN